VSSFCNLSSLTKNISSLEENCLRQWNELKNCYLFFHGLVIAQESHSSWFEEKSLFLDSMNEFKVSVLLKVTE